MIKRLLILLILGMYSVLMSQDYSIINVDKWVKIGYNNNFPEGPSYDGEKYIFISNCYGRWISKFTKDDISGKDSISLSAADNVLIDFRADTAIVNRTNGLVNVNGELYACEYGNGSLVKINSSGKPEVVSKGYEGIRFNRPNDLCFDGEKSIYFTDPKSYNKEVLDGRIFRFNIETKQTELVCSNLAFPNGIKLSNDKEYLYVCESAKQVVTKIKVDKDGYLAERTTFVELPGGDPDGIEFDEENNLYVAHYGGKAIYKISSDGKIVTKYITPGKKPSNIELIDGYLLITECETNSIYTMKIE